MNDFEELVIGQKTWKRSMSGIEKDGFREGFEAGRKVSLQNGFNIGYKEGFNSYYEKVSFETKKHILEKIQGKYELPKLECVYCTNDADGIMEL